MSSERGKVLAYGRPASQPASDAQCNASIHNVAKSWGGCFSWPFAPFLVCSAVKDASSKLIMHTAAPVFVLLFVFSFFLSSFLFLSFFYCLPLCLPFSPCPFSLTSLIRFRFFIPIPPSLFLSFLLSFVLSFLISCFPLSHFCVSLCTSEHKNDEQNRHKKVKYSKK